MNRTALFFAVMSLLFAGLFGADLLGYFNRARNPVAVLGRSQGNVKRLGKDQLTWDRAAGGTQFGGGDTIATGEDSRAKLEIFAGGELELEAGSMVVLGDDLHELKLNFISGGGKIRLTKAAKGKIAVQRKIASTGSPAASSPPIEIEEVEELESTGGIVASAAEMAGPKTPRIAAPAIQEKNMRDPKQGLSVRPGELLSVQALPAMPVISEPADDAVISLKGGSVPKFAWSVPAAAKTATTAKEQLTYEVIIRPAQGGPEKVLLSDKPTLPLDRLAQGKYLWAVRAINAEGKRGPPSGLRGVEVKIPEQIAKPVILPVQVE